MYSEDDATMKVAEVFLQKNGSKAYKVSAAFGKKKYYILELAKNAMAPKCRKLRDASLGHRIEIQLKQKIFGMRKTRRKQLAENNSSKTTRRKQLVENNSPKREVGKLVEN